MHVFSHDRFTFPLPPGHRFPLPKYRLLRERLLADGLTGPGEVHEPSPSPGPTCGAFTTAPCCSASARAA